MLITLLKFRLFSLLFCVLYVPTQNYRQNQIDFIAKVKREVECHTDGEQNVLVCGDFNLHLSNLDTQNRFRLTQAATDLRSFMKDLSLVDVWRERYKDRRQYTLGWGEK